MKVEIRRSKRRKKMVSAKLDDDVMHVFALHNIPGKELKKVIENFKRYNLAERARGFLIAKGMEDNQELDIE